MQKIKLWYNQNIKRIWLILGIIAVIVIFVQILNYFSGRKEGEKRIAVNMTTNNDLKEIKNETNVDLESTQSVITGENVPKEALKTASEVIGEFFDFCNQGDIQGAYDLLTDDCKKQIYSSVEIFEQAYYQDVFGGEQKIYSVENWIGDTYKVSITENMLATGKSNNGYSKQDYMTVKEIDGEYKLNINNYIGHQEINKMTDDKDNNIVVDVLCKDIYMDRVEYTIKVTNNNDTAITLDGRSNVESLYLESNRGGHYPAYTHELTDPMLNLGQGETKELTIKFYCSYNSTTNIDEIVFSDVIIYENQGSERIEVRAEV